jgi:hypothetical protein
MPAKQPARDMQQAESKTKWMNLPDEGVERREFEASYSVDFGAGIAQSV